jgi:hypothetical protein
MKKIFLSGIMFSLFIWGCKNNVPDRIKVENRLSKNIICVFGYNYPDLNMNYTSKQALLADSTFLQIDTNQIKELDTLGLCKKDVWNKHVRQSLLMLVIFDKKKLIHVKNMEDAVLERYYLSYSQLIKDKGLIVVY